MSEGTKLRAVVADDERLLREQLKARLATAWPDLEVVAEARDGLEAVEKADQLRPDVLFLDIRMPGLTGIEAAGEIVALPDWRGEIVFVTAYDEYAIQAFERGALDYLLKPVEPERLAQTAQRVRQRLAERQGPAGASPPEEAIDALLARLASLRQGLAAQGPSLPPLRWIRCTAGTTTRLIDVNDVLFLRSDEKYTRVQARDQEGFLRTPIRELLPQLDPQQFCQVHRSTVVNLAAIDHVTRDDTGRQRIHLRNFPEVLEVSRTFSHLFRSS